MAKRTQNDAGKSLPLLARRTIQLHLERKPIPTQAEAEKLLGRGFKMACEDRAAFVTLTIEGHLRGCIGSLIAEGPLWRDVRDNAISAAFHDPRFYPVTLEELPKIKIEVSVLSPLYRMRYSGPDDLLAKLEKGVQGLMLRFPDGSGATYLPQVWDDLPDKEEFLSELCRKAGKERDAWKTERPEVFVYTVEKMEE